MDQRTQLFSRIGRTEANYPHTGSPTSLDAIERVFKDKAMGGVFMQILGCQEITLRVGFTLGDPIGGDYGVEKAIQLEHLESTLDLHVVGAGD